MAEECASLFLVFGGSNDSDAHTEYVAQIFVHHFGENRMLLDADGDVANLVYRTGRNAAEVTGAGKRDIEKLVQKAVHTLAAERYLHPNRVSLPCFVARDGLLRRPFRCFLSGDAGETVLDNFYLLLIFERPDTARHHHLTQARRLHGVYVSHLFFESCESFFLLFFD